MTMHSPETGRVLGCSSIPAQTHASGNASLCPLAPCEPSRHVLQTQAYMRSHQPQKICCMLSQLSPRVGKVHHPGSLPGVPHIHTPLPPASHPVTPAAPCTHNAHLPGHTARVSHCTLLQPTAAPTFAAACPPAALRPLLADMRPPEHRPHLSNQGLLGQAGCMLPVAPAHTSRHITRRHRRCRRHLRPAWPCLPGAAAPPARLKRWAAPLHCGPCRPVPG